MRNVESEIAKDVETSQDNAQINTGDPYNNLFNFGASHLW
mgnify:CR=1 FL=1